MRSKLETVATLTIVVTALLIAVAAVRMAFFSTTPETGSAGRGTPELLDELMWNEIVGAGALVGGTSRGRPVTVVEFMDLECPFCRNSHFAIADARRVFGDSLAHMVVHYPLGFHRFAIPAARAAECAQSVGRFSEYLDVVFEKQDSLGIKTWVSYAVEAGVADTVQFKECNARVGKLVAVEQGRELGERIGIRGTPAILVNGWLLPEPPPDAEAYVDIITRILAGAAPYGR